MVLETFPGKEAVLLEAVVLRFVGVAVVAIFLDKKSVPYSLNESVARAEMILTMRAVQA
jgi:hypothetical protein